MEVCERVIYRTTTGLRRTHEAIPVSFQRAERWDKARRPRLEVERVYIDSNAQLYNFFSIAKLRMILLYVSCVGLKKVLPIVLKGRLSTRRKRNNITAISDNNNRQQRLNRRQ